MFDKKILKILKKLPPKPLSQHVRPDSNRVLTATPTVPVPGSLPRQSVVDSVPENRGKERKVGSDHSGFRLLLSDSPSHSLSSHVAKFNWLLKE